MAEWKDVDCSCEIEVLCIEPNCRLDGQILKGRVVRCYNIEGGRFVAIEDQNGERWRVLPERDILLSCASDHDTGKIVGI